MVILFELFFLLVIIEQFTYVRITQDSRFANGGTGRKKAEVCRNDSDNCCFIGYLHRDKFCLGCQDYCAERIVQMNYCVQMVVLVS